MALMAGIRHRACVPDGHPGGLRFSFGARRRRFRRRRLHGRLRLAGGVPHRRRHPVAAVPRSSSCSSRSRCRACSATHRPMPACASSASVWRPGWQPPPAQADAEPAASLTVLELFRHGYARPTLLLWATFFVSLILLYFMVSWLPSLLQESGLTRNAANLATSMFLFAGTLGAMLLAWFRRPPAQQGPPAGGDSRRRRAVHPAPRPQPRPAALAAGVRLRRRLLHHRRAVDPERLRQQLLPGRYAPPAPAGRWAWAASGSILGPLFGSLLLGMHISVENIFMLAAIPAGLAALLILQVRSPAAQARGKAPPRWPSRNPEPSPRAASRLRWRAVSPSAAGATDERRRQPPRITNACASRRSVRCSRSSKAPAKAR